MSKFSTACRWTVPVSAEMHWLRFAGLLKKGPAQKGRLWHGNCTPGLTLKHPGFRRASDRDLADYRNPSQSRSWLLFRSRILVLFRHTANIETLSMQNTLQNRSTFPFSMLLSGFALMGPLLTGCGETAPKLEARVTSPVGRPGVCAYCNERIAEVTEDHLTTVEAIEYIVCDKKCESDLKRWVAEQ